MHASIASAALAVFLLVGTSAGASEFHYVLIFASESTPKRLVKTHTFATFVRAVGEGSDPADYAIEAHTISWLPATLVIRPFAARSELGANLGLAQTLEYARRNGEAVSLWGPYRIPPRIYRRSALQFRRLNSGDVTYRAGDSVTDPDICDCIHAVSDVDPDFGRGHYPLVRVGRAASGYIARQFEARGYNDPSEDHGWLIGRLGLGGCPIEVIPPRSREQALSKLCRVSPTARRRGCFDPGDPLAKYAPPEDQLRCARP